MKTALLLCITFASASFAWADPPPPTSTSPSAASSPHQRESTTTPAKEAPAANTPAPADAATPHQKQVTEGAAMKDCVTKQQSADASLSKDDAKKACTEQMKTKAREPQKQ